MSKWGKWLLLIGVFGSSWSLIQIQSIPVAELICLLGCLLVSFRETLLTPQKRNQKVKNPYLRKVTLFILIVILSSMYGIFSGVNTGLLTNRNSIVLVAVSGSKVISDSNYYSGQLIAVAKWIAVILLAAWIFGAAKRIGDNFPETLIRTWFMGILINIAVAEMQWIQIIKFLPRFFEAGPNSLQRYAGLTNHPNILGSLCVLAIPFCVSLDFSSRSILRLPLKIIVIACVLGGSILTGSRASISAAVIALFFSMWFLYPQGRLKMILFSCVSLIVLALIFADLSGNSIITTTLSHTRLFGSNSLTASSDVGRLSLQNLAINEFYSSPIFGVGPIIAKDNHSLVLQLLASTGILGFLSFYFVIISSVFAKKQRKNSNNLAQVLRYSIMFFMLEDIFNNSITDLFIYLPVAALLALSQTIPKSILRSKQNTYR